MNSVIRKISIGADYKNEAMHYSVGQSVYGGHTINNITLDEADNSYNIFIKKQDEVMPWTVSYTHLTLPTKRIV